MNRLRSKVAQGNVARAEKVSRAFKDMGWRVTCRVGDEGHEQNSAVWRISHIKK